VSQIRHALDVKREDDFAKWYQEVISAADLAEESGVRGCMVIKPWGYGIWERIQRLMDDRIKAAGVSNCYFPLFIPLANFTREAEHVEGFAKEMAVVTHHRLISDGKGGLIPDPEAKLEEPLVVRPTSETIIGDAMARWVQSWRDLPLLTNQWANVVRWEMRTRMFLRTSEFLWQEGHTAHETREDALAETHRALEMYRACAEDDLALPVIAGEKPENERFPGAVETWSIEAMMQDGKALQAGTSHYLGTNFAHAAGIQYQDREGSQQYCHTTSWGVSTRLIGGVIMTHGDDDGLRVPPKIAPYQVVILPRLTGKGDDDLLLSKAEFLASLLRTYSVFDEKVRVFVDKSTAKFAPKNWDWIRKGVPLILHIGPRDIAGAVVPYVRRDQLWNVDVYGEYDGMIQYNQFQETDFSSVPSILEQIQQGLFEDARTRRDANITRGVAQWQAVVDHFEKGGKFPGWVEVEWAKPTGAALDAVVEKLKAVKLTIRNVPRGSEPAGGTCIFTGEPAVERILVARAY
jgi:prolyl-tRNA synthetase